MTWRGLVGRQCGYHNGISLIHTRRKMRMPFHTKNHFRRVLATLAAMIVCLCVFGTPAAAQDRPAPKWELYGGYSFIYPGAVVHGELPGALLPLSDSLDSNPRGVGGSITYDFNRWFGLTLDASTHWGSSEKGVGARIDDAAFSNISFGPKITFRRHRVSPFLEALVGNHRLTPDLFHDVDKLGFMFGGGLDINLSRHVALRLLRADYVYSNYRFGSADVTPQTQIRGVRLQSGLVFRFGGAPPPPPPNRSPVASCSVDKSSVFAGSGDVALVRATASDPDNDPLSYSWTTSGGRVDGSGPEARWNSSGAGPGNYTVSVRVHDGRGGTAACSADIRVERRPNRPPTINCSPDHRAVTAGDPLEITAIASDPDNDPLSFSWNTSGGKIQGSGASVRFQTDGLPPGLYTITGHVDDGRDGTADCSLSVDVQAPQPPAEVRELETRLALHSIYFPTARPTIANPTGGLVESQQKVLLSLATDFNRYLTFKPQAHLILEGHADRRGSIEYNQNLTERRVERTKSFLVEHGVPDANIETRALGNQENLDAEQVKQLIGQNPDLSNEERERIESNLQVIVLANNRRVDVSLNTTGQQSVRQYPFNAKDSLTLLSTKGGEGEKRAKPPVKRKAAQR